MCINQEPFGLNDPAGITTQRKNLQGLELPVIATPSHKHEHDRDANAGRQRGAGLGSEQERVQGLQLPRGVWGGMAFSSPSCLGVHRALGRWTKQPWVPKWPRVLPGLITGCRVTCKSSCSIRNANGLLPFPCSTSPDPDAKEVGKLPSSWPFPEPPDRPRCCLLQLCSPCPSRTEQPGSAAAKGAPWGGSSGARTLQPPRELLGKGLRGLRPCSR